MADWLDPRASSLAGLRPQPITPAIGPREPGISERFSHWLSSMGWPRWQAERIGSVIPYTPPGQAFQGGQDIARGWAESDPWQMASGAGQVGLSALPLAAFGRAAPRSGSGLSFTPWDVQHWLQRAGARTPRVNETRGGTSYVEFGNVGNRGESWQVRVPSDAHAQLAGPHQRYWDRMLDTGTISRSTGYPVRTPSTHSPAGAPYSDWDTLTTQLRQILDENKIARAKSRGPVPGISATISIGR